MGWLSRSRIADGCLLGGVLFTGLDDAATFQPPATETIARTRDRLNGGAHGLAFHGEEGFDMLIERRIVPGTIGELERSVGNPTQQGACTWA